MLETFDGGEEFENHKEDKNEANEDDGVDIARDANPEGDIVAQVWPDGDCCHTAPDDDADGELDESLPALMFDKIFNTLADHEEGEDGDDYLVKREGHKRIN